MKFNTFNLTKPVRSTLERINLVDVSPIQEKTLALSLKGASLVAKAPTGSGKTHAFLIPAINQINTQLGFPQVLIIVPTIELGRQTIEFIKDFQVEQPELTFKFLEDFDFKTKVKADIIVATPSKLRRLKLSSGLIDLSHIKVVILDEADMLSSDEFFDDIDLIINQIQQRIQYLVFSATYSEQLLFRLKKYIQAINVISIKEGVKNQKINYYALDLKHQPMLPTLMKFIKITKPYLLLIFAKTTEAVEEISTYLQKNDFENIKLHGKLTDNERKLAFKRIKENKHHIIVCSDLMARGIDFSDVSDVLSVDIPKDHAFFFHRVGRTARFDKQGNAYLFYNVEDEKEVQDLIKLGANFRFVSISGDEIKAKRTAPIFLKGKGNNDPELQKAIKKALSTVPKTKVKPNHKKKARVAREKAIKKHNQKKLKDKIRKERYGRGGSNNG